MYCEGSGHDLVQKIAGLSGFARSGIFAQPTRVTERLTLAGIITITDVKLEFVLQSMIVL